MDYFGYQEQARKNTFWLVFLFVAAVIVVVMAVYIAVVGGFFAGQFMQEYPHMYIDAFWNPVLFTCTTCFTLMLVVGGSIYRTLDLKKGGGAAVAEMLGGQRVPVATDQPLLRRLRNVTEEMAIASGLSVPPLYVLPQQSINAFAAGFSSPDAVIAVTQGAVDLLHRDALQGVIAHEFSHIVHGDTRLKMRLMGLLFGITLISDAGMVLLTSQRTVRYRRKRGTHPAAIVLGLLLFFVGTIGAIFADIIKRAVSRQREFLADAAAVQFTRNPLGLAEALKIIGGYQEGSRIHHAAANQASHFFFGDVHKPTATHNIWATHPPLQERICRLDPSFSGTMEKIQPDKNRSTAFEQAISELQRAEKIEPLVHSASADPVAWQHTMGRQPGPEHLAKAKQLLQMIPPRIKAFVHDPYTARAVIYSVCCLPNARHASRHCRYCNRPLIHRSIGRCWIFK